jgi:hypothetical protein
MPRYIVNALQCRYYLTREPACGKILQKVMSRTTMRLESKHFFSLAVVGISAEPISVFCGLNTRGLDGWSGAYSNITMCEL